jgi:hypothetical protein
MRCLDCGIITTTTNNDYMLHNELWVKINPLIDGRLCIPCAERRLGRPFVPDDLPDVPLNSMGSPYIRSLLAQ